MYGPRNRSCGWSVVTVAVRPRIAPLVVGAADCTPGQQGYSYSANKYDDTPDKFYKRAVVDHLNGLFDDVDKGPTYAKFDRNGRGQGRNRPRVPEGQTFTDIPGGRASLTDHGEAILRSRGQQRP